MAKPHNMKKTEMGMIVDDVKWQEICRTMQALVFERHGKTLRGHFWTRDGMVTVKSSDGRQKTTQIGGSPPQALAELMLVELEEARLGNAMFALPGD